MLIIHKKIVTNPLAAAAVILTVWLLINRLNAVLPQSSMAFPILVSAFLINTVVFFFGYSLMELPKTPQLWKGLLYLITLTGANWCLTMLRLWEWSMDWTFLHQHLFFNLPFLVSLPLNFCFLKYLFKMDNQRAISVGLLLGMIEAQSTIVSIPVF